MLAKKVHNQMPNNHSYLLRKNEIRKIPKLSELALKIVSQNFEYYQNFNNIPKEISKKVISKIIETNFEIPIEIAAKNISDENFWKNMCNKLSIGDCLPQDHGGSFKQAYIERYTEKMIESLKSSSEGELLITRLAVLKNFIFNLLISSLPSHIDVQVLFSILTNLTSISITFGINSNGYNYKAKIIINL